MQLIMYHLKIIPADMCIKKSHSIQLLSYQLSFLYYCRPILQPYVDQLEVDGLSCFILHDRVIANSKLFRMDWLWTCRRKERFFYNFCCKTGICRRWGKQDSWSSFFIGVSSLPCRNLRPRFLSLGATLARLDQAKCRWRPEK